MLGDNMLNAGEEESPYPLVYSDTPSTMALSGWTPTCSVGLMGNTSRPDQVERHLENQDPVWGSHILEMNLEPEAWAG